MKLAAALGFASLLFAQAPAASDQRATAIFRIEGMTCEGCASAVEVQLEQTEGVLGSSVSFERGEARVSYDPAKTTPEKIAAAIGLTGFRAWVKSANAAELRVLDSLAPLLADFNAARGKPRFLAILSPSCGECAHGAQAVREALLREGAPPALEVFVVWSPMLAGDDEAAARAAATLFDARVLQYYDPARRAGTAFRSQVFPEAVAQMRRSLPPGHFLAQRFATRDPAQPEWDIYLFFGRDAEWTAEAPRPARFVRQVVRLDERSSIFWKNDYARAPLEGSLAQALREEAAALLER
jgi:copper chaperone CopZ